jgi:hypothetical protein
MTDDIWIGLAHVKPRDKQSPFSEGAEGAYSNVLTRAKDSAEFEQKVEEEVRQRGLVIVDMVDVETFEQRAGSHDVSANLYILAELAMATGEVQFDAFYNYFAESEI